MRFSACYIHRIYSVGHFGACKLEVTSGHFLDERINYWIFDCLVISQLEQICKWGIKYAHSVITDHVGSTCTPHYPHTKFDENRSSVILIREQRFTFWCWRETYVHTYICTYRQRDKWKLSGPSSIAGGPQKIKWE